MSTYELQLLGTGLYEGVPPDAQLKYGCRRGIIHVQVYKLKAALKQFTVSTVYSV